MHEVIPNHEFQRLSQKMLANVSKDYLARINKLHDQIVSDNRALTGCNGYLIGKHGFFSDSLRKYPMTKIRNAMTMRPLDPSLIPAHQVWFQQFDQHEREWRGVCQTIASLVMRVKDWQGFRDMFPDYVARSILQEPELASLTRRNPDLYAGLPPADPMLQYAFDKEQHAREMVWGQRPIEMYGRVAPLVNLYVGYKLL